MTVDRRQVLTGPIAAAAVATVSMLPAPAVGAATVTDLLAKYRVAFAHYMAGRARHYAVPDDEAVEAEYEKLCDHMMEMEPIICRTPPRDVREAVMLLRFVRDNVMGCPFTDDAAMSIWNDCRDFIAIDSILAVLEGLGQ